MFRLFQCSPNDKLSGSPVRQDGSGRDVVCGRDGGNVKGLVNLAKSGRKIIVLDGCPLACARECLRNHNVSPDLHMELSRAGVEKKLHADFDIEHANQLLLLLCEYHKPEYV